jgi:LAO/AO transport system kinase
MKKSDHDHKRNSTESQKLNEFTQMKRTFQKRKQQVGITNEELIEGILAGDRSLLSRGITLIESNAEHHFQQAQSLLQQLLPYTGKSLRIGITGVPGAGKSTFIECFGHYVCELGLKVAVLAIDPSSTVSGGSILGDKTRMEKLANHSRAFIRPSPSSGRLGGIHRKTRETIFLCEAFGFDIILVETVGVGQSEVTVRDMVDFFMLLVLSGAGDELQGMKKGIIEQADAIIVNKADGPNKQNAITTKNEYNTFLHFLSPATKGWETKAYTVSALYEEGIQEIWQVIKDFELMIKETSIFEERRRLQTKEWMKSMILDQLQFHFFQHSEVKELLPKLENEVLIGKMTVTKAVEELFKKYIHSF